MDITKLVGTAIRWRLSNTADILALLTSADRIQSMTVPGTVAMPYITYSLASGGYLNNTPKDAFDAEFLITAIAQTQPDAQRLSELINEALHRQDVNYPLGWKNWARVNQTLPFIDLQTLQNVQFWRVGGFYRFRGIEE